MSNIAIVLYGALLLQTPVKLEPRVDPRIDALAQSVVGSKTPGLAVAVIHHGKVVQARAYGVTDLQTRQPFTLTTPTYIASIAKMFTAFAILQQVERGELSLDSKLGDLLPEAPAYAKAVTLRQLLQHTSGLVDHLDIGGDDRRYSYDDVVRILNDADSLLFAPQSRSSYSNSAYVLLARILERTARTTFEDYLDRNFFTPIGMNATVVTADAQRPQARARGYVLENGAHVLRDYQVSTTKGAGGMYASLDDLYRWAMAMRAHRFLRPETLRTASTAAVRTNGRPTPWGMGWLAEYHGERDPLKGKTYVAAMGQLGGFQGLMKWYQDEDLFIIWLANTQSSDVFDAMHNIAAMMLLPGS
jgi:CubicO group peptidase (beta-lactamase class C family)